MQIKIKRIDRSLPLPKYHTQGAVAFDLYSRLDVSIAPHGVYRIPTNLVIEAPPGYMLYIKDRSSTAGKGLLATAGIVDQDYCGPNDEILFQVYNFTAQEIKVYRGERIAQGIFVRIEKADWEESEGSIVPKTRGGFGTSGDS